MHQISLLIKPASSLCNMKCAYCFYKDEATHRSQANMGIMTKETVTAIVEKSLSLPVNQINYCFQGGEPTLAGLSYFQFFIDEVNKINSGKTITYSIQTNGLELNEEWFQFFLKYHFLVGISLDGFMTNHDACRKDYQLKDTFSIILNHIKRMDEMKIDYNILTVLTHQLSKSPLELFQFYLENDLKYIQLIPCLPSLEENPLLDNYALKPKDFANFYKSFFDAWHKEYTKGNYISVTLFDNIIPMYLGIAPSLCGMLGKCHMQFVIEGDGSIYPCDFYVLDNYCCGNIHTHTLIEAINHQHAYKFLNEKNNIAPVCNQCMFYKMCYGYCKRMNVCLRDENYCGYQDFLAYTRDRMRKIANKIR